MTCNRNIPGFILALGPCCTSYPSLSPRISTLFCQIKAKMPKKCISVWNWWLLKGWTCHLSGSSTTVKCGCLLQSTVAPYCASTEAFKGCANLKCDPVINLHFPDRAEQFFYHLCKTSLCTRVRSKCDLAVAFCTAPWVLLSTLLLRLLTQSCGMKGLSRQTRCIIAFVRNPFWSLKGSNAIPMIVPLSNIAFIFLPWYSSELRVIMGRGKD